MNQEDVIAERSLLFSSKGASSRKILEIKVGRPYKHSEEDCFVCDVVWLGISRSYDVAGVDSLQAVQLAVDVEPQLKALANEYDLFFDSGEPYFE